MTPINRMRCFLQAVIDERAKLNDTTTIEKIGLIVLPILMAVISHIVIRNDSVLWKCEMIQVTGYSVALYAMAAFFANYPSSENAEKALNCIINSTKKSVEVLFESLKQINMTEKSDIIHKSFQVLNRFNSINVLIGCGGLLLFIYCLPRGKAPLLSILGATSIFLVSFGMIALDRAFKPVDLAAIQGNLTKCLE